MNKVEKKRQKEQYVQREGFTEDESVAETLEQEGD